MRKVLSVLLSGFIPFVLLSQSITPQVIGSAGGYFAVGSTHLGWTVGEPVTTTYSAGNAEITQGFHQPTYRIVALEPSVGSQFEITVFPNPAVKEIQIEWNSENLLKFGKHFEAKLFDLRGREIANKTLVVSEGKGNIDLSFVSAGRYTLRFSSGMEILGSGFQIQKIR